MASFGSISVSCTWGVLVSFAALEIAGCSQSQQTQVPSEEPDPKTLQGATSVADANLRQQAISFLYEATLYVEENCPRGKWRRKQAGYRDLTGLRSALEKAGQGNAASKEVERLIETFIKARLRVYEWDSIRLTADSHRRYAREMFATYCRVPRTLP